MVSGNGIHSADADETGLVKDLGLGIEIACKSQGEAMSFLQFEVAGMEKNPASHSS